MSARSARSLRSLALPFGLRSSSWNIQGMKRKYRARDWIVLVPGKSRSAIASRIDPTPSSSRVSRSESVPARFCACWCSRSEYASQVNVDCPTRSRLNEALSEAALYEGRSWQVGSVQVHMPLHGIEDARDAVELSLLDGQAEEILGDRLHRDGQLVAAERRSVALQKLSCPRSRIGPASCRIPLAGSRVAPSRSADNGPQVPLGPVASPNVNSAG